ncbi:bifunctional methylenetetrahydrofolate dehydrogenase/methenyltetrahydrofolate cyclohydrolase FolD [Rosettibacter firmus]|uniref:bifunctional methylenetetrahydrofolate dehydrogenase/methenyltetrahydrofolate cyclohydrolase FolD n=1 Tax=Rosettibacter firmus TaxID=3111522 RepID=UPI00336BBAB4
MAILIDGKKISEEIKKELKLKIQEVKDKTGKVPGLVAILVGDNPASQLYVSSKSKACNEIGMNSKVEKLSSNISEEDLINIVNQYNHDDNYHGILVQLPLPGHISEQKIIETILPSKDVDGFHPVNVGNLVIGNDTFYPCTPYGIVELLKRYSIETKGKHVVVVGRSNIVGKPIANMLLQKKDGANAIVTICHSAAKDLNRYTKDADILIAAIGKENFITSDMVKEGVVVIDVGINRIEDKNSKKGYRIVGDVKFDEVEKVASYITPVPGGVGPMTIAMLLKNTFLAFIKSLEKNYGYIIN